MATVTHRFTSAKADGGDATLVQPGDWNDPHEGAQAVVNVVTDHDAAGDGVTDDLAEIHAARDAAGVDGTVYFPEGTFLISATITANVVGQRWLLAKGATIKLANAAESSMFTVSAGTDRLTLEGGAFDGNRANQTTTSASVVFVSSGVDDLTIRNVRIIEAAGYGIRVKGGTGTVNLRNRIDSCYVDGCDLHGLVFQWEVEDSWIVDCYVANTVGDGIDLANTSNNNVVRGNIVRNAGAIGIEVASVTDQGVVVADNIVIDSTTMGISMGASNHQCVVAGNRVYSPGSIGIELIGDALTCIGNTIKDAGGVGIARHDSYGVIEGNTVDGFGTLQANSAAIKVAEGAAVSHLDNIISNNVIRFPATNPQGTNRGIWLQCNNASEVIRGTIISNNRIIDQSGGGGTRNGIVLSPGTGTLEDTLIFGNVIDTTFTNRFSTAGSPTYKTLEVVTANALKTVLDTDHTAAADPHTGYVLESLVDAAGDIYIGSAADTVARLARGSDDQVLRSTASTVAWESQEFTVGAVVKSPVDGDLVIVWRAPFACTVTAVRGYSDAGTTSVVNAFKGTLASPTNFCSTNITIDPADAWENGTVTTSTVAAGDAVGVRVVTAGTATELSIQIDFTRP